MTIETVFKADETEALCAEIAKGEAMRSKMSTMLLYAVGGCALYGFTMGLNHSLLQAATSSVKVFLLFALTLAICLPTLHFIGLLFGSSIRFTQTTSVLLTGVTLASILLGAFAPISLFFLVSGSSYEFLLLLHVGIFAFCGGAGLMSVWKNVNRLLKLAGNDENKQSSSKLLNCWFGLYMFIGAQMSFLLSPFIGTSTDFMLFASAKGDFFSYVLKHLGEFLK